MTGMSDYETTPPAVSPMPSAEASIPARSIMGLLASDERPDVKLATLAVWCLPPGTEVGDEHVARWSGRAQGGFVRRILVEQGYLTAVPVMSDRGRAVVRWVVAEEMTAAGEE